MIPKRRVGVPYRVRANDADYSSFTTNVEYKDKPVSWKSQNKVFQEYLNNPFKEECYTYVLSCDYNNIIPQLAIKNLVTKLQDENKNVFWYNISKNHKQEDERLCSYIQETGCVDVLIIDGLYTKTNINNIDKLRELLALFDDIPVYVIVSGGFGPTFFMEQVFCPFNLFIHFNDSPRKKTIDI